MATNNWGSFTPKIFVEALIRKSFLCYKTQTIFCCFFFLTGFRSTKRIWLHMRPGGRFLDKSLLQQRRMVGFGYEARVMYLRVSCRHVLRQQQAADITRWATMDISMTLGRAVARYVLLVTVSEISPQTFEFFVFHQKRNTSLSFSSFFIQTVVSVNHLYAYETV